MNEQHTGNHKTSPWAFIAITVLILFVGVIAYVFWFQFNVLYQGAMQNVQVTEQVDDTDELVIDEEADDESDTVVIDEANEPVESEEEEILSSPASCEECSIEEDSILQYRESDSSITVEFRSTFAENFSLNFPARWNFVSIRQVDLSASGSGTQTPGIIEYVFQPNGFITQEDLSLRIYVTRTAFPTASGQYGATPFATVGENDYSWVISHGASCPSPLIQLSPNTQCIYENVKFSDDVDHILDSLTGL